MSDHATTEELALQESLAVADPPQETASEQETVGETPESADFHLHEATSSLTEASVASDGTILIEALRPCIGNGKGRHVYESDMLRENAHKLAGWKMYIDHQSDVAKRQAGGLPRSIRDLGGRIVESYWDDSVPAEGRFEQGAIMARVRPVKFIRELIEDDPELVEASINARATGVRPVSRDGKRAWLVEGIENKGSVDFVTEGGAGGRIRALMESVYSAPDAEEQALLETIADDELEAYLYAHRPDLIDSIVEAEDEDEDEDDEVQKLAKKFMKNGMPEKVAMAAAKRAMAKKQKKNVQEADADLLTTDNEDTTMITPEDLREALATPEGRSLVRDLMRDEVTDLVEAEMDSERELIQAEAEARSDRRIELRDFRDIAHEMIEGATRLPDSLKRDLRSRFTLIEGRATDALDVVDEIDEDGNIVTSAEEVLRESVEEALSEARKLVGEISPTRVRNQGPSNPDGPADDNNEGPAPYWKTVLQEAGVNPDEAYA